jgi:hypothetical protein
MGCYASMLAPILLYASADYQRRFAGEEVWKFFGGFFQDA